MSAQTPARRSYDVLYLVQESLPPSLVVGHPERRRRWSAGHPGVAGAPGILRAAPGILRAAPGILRAAKDLPADGTMLRCAQHDNTLHKLLRCAQHDTTPEQLPSSETSGPTLQGLGSRRPVRLPAPGHPRAGSRTRIPQRVTPIPPFQGGQFCAGVGLVAYRVKTP